MSIVEDSPILSPTFGRRMTSTYAVTTSVLIFAAASAPTPLYRLYEASWGLSAFTVTVIFAAYAAGFLAALLTVASLSDFVGRKPVIFVSLLVNATVMYFSANAHDARMLTFARVLQGIATGSAASTLGATIVDTTRSRGALFNSIIPDVGTATGALSSSVLVQYSFAPTRLVFLLFLAIFCMFAALDLVIDETAPRRPGALASLRPRVNVPTRVRSLFWSITPVNCAVWALGGFYLSVMPALVRLTTGSLSGLFVGIATGTLTLSGATAIIALHRFPPAKVFRTGTMALILGVLVTLGGVALRSIPLLVLGTVVAGVGFGTSYFGGLRTLLSLADATDRAALLSAIYIQCYLAFSLPAVAVGLLLPFIGLLLATYLYGTALIILGTTSLVLTSSKRNALVTGN
jgi:MFS family permease